ncbi:MAG TPA: TlpA family protein disulfide reductase [Firmicutes bacterium]|nr:TlpA family protein disulfide reductase [Bacillota bacterium]
MFRSILLLLVILALYINVALSAQAPDITLKDINNKSVTLSDLYSENVVLIEFWSTTCEPCKKQLPKMQALLDKYGDKGLVVVSIATDSARMMSKVKPYVNGNRYTFITLHDPDQKAWKAFHAPAEPYTIVVDKGGEVAYVHIGYNPGDEYEMESVVVNLLGIEGTWKKLTD